MRTQIQPGEGYRHDAFFYRGDDEFLSTALPFVNDGLDRNQPVMVAVIERRGSLMRAALGAAAGRVRFVDMRQLGANPAHIIPCWRAFIDDCRPRPMRGIGEPIWRGRSPEELAESQFHEALLNVAVPPDTPMWLTCPYDREALPPEVVAEARRSHPTLVDDQGHHGSTSYGGLHHVEEIFGRPLPEPEPSVQRLVVGRQDVAGLRDLVRRSARDAGLPASRADDLDLAVLGLAASSLQRGDGVSAVRVWRDSRQLTVEISDPGRIDDPMIGRTDSSSAGPGRAVWVANELCDLVQIRSGSGGTVVRVLTWLQ